MSTIQETAILSKLRSRGYLRVVIRPTTFQEKRIARFDDLLPIIERNSVQFRGWDYPHVDHLRPPLRGDDWVGQEYDCEDQIEVWRFLPEWPVPSLSRDRGRLERSVDVLARGTRMGSTA